MTKKLSLEKINNENFDEFFKLIKKLAEYEKQESLDENVKKRLKNDGLSDNPKFKAYLAKYENEYVGYLIYFMTYSSYLALPALYLEDIFVLKQYRRNGIGQKMFDFCIKKAHENKCGRMEWCVYNWNKTAIKFYEKNNAKKLNKSYCRLNKKTIQNIRESLDQ